MREKQSTGAATLLIHIDRNAATLIMASRTHFGPVPALRSTADAIILAMWCLLKAAASVKPPRSSIITGENMSENTFFAADLASMRKPVSGNRSTPRTTTKNGTSSAVTNSGMT